MSTTADLDTALKHLVQYAPDVIARIVLGPDAPAGVRGEVPSEIARLVRRPDALVHLADGRCLHIEFESSPNRRTVLRLLEYHVLLLRQVAERGANPFDLESVVVLLRGPQPRFLTGEYRSVRPDRLCFRYRVVNLCGQPAQTMASDPHLAAFVALAEDVQEADISAARATLHQHWGHDPARLAELVAVLGALGDDWMRTFAFAQFPEVQMSQLLQIFREKGWVEGRQEGLVEGQVQMLARQLRLRFPEEDWSVVLTAAAVGSPEQRLAALDLIAGVRRPTTLRTRLLALFGEVRREGSLS